MKEKLLILDLDGTLADTLNTIRDTVNMCMEHFGFPTLNYEETRVKVGNGVSSLISLALPQDADVSEEKFEEILAYFRECYLINHDKIDGCYDGLYEVLVALREKGYKLAVLSNKPDNLVGGIIKKLFPEGFFVKFMGQTELPRKPDPTVPLMISSEQGIAVEDCYFIGDSEVDIATAKNSGMHSVAVSWGFRDRCVLEDSEPEVIIDTPAELLAFFSA